MIVTVLFSMIFCTAESTAEEQGVERERMIVRYRSEEVKESVMDILESSQSRYIKEIEQGKLLVYTVPPGAYDRLAGDLDLAGLTDYTEKDHIVTAASLPNDPLWKDQWNMRMVDVDYTWDVVRGDPSVLVALLDTGVDYTHRDLDGNVDESLGWDYVNNDNDPQDDNDHGTAVAGIICAEIDNDLGIAGMAQVTLVPMKVLDQYGMGYTSDVIDAIYDAGDAGARVITICFGNYSASSSLQNAVEWAYNTKGIFLTAAAGGDGTSSRYYPAAYPDVVGVGAVDQNGNRTVWSNYGRNVELMAPGVDVITTIPGNGYAFYSGTSMACPHVASAAALAFSFNPGLTNVQVRNILRNWADDIGDPGVDPYTGFGLLDCWNALD